MGKKLSGRIALVAGATRGAGRAIARCLGEAGAVVYGTGRSTRTQPGGGMARAETIEETAELVTAAGGEGIAVRVDHTKPEEVAELVLRIERDHGGLDVLVNDIWGGDELAEWGTPFWEQSLEKGRLMLERGLWTHLVTSRHAVPLLLRRPGGLVVEIGDGEAHWYRENLFYDLVKSAILRVAFAMSEELGSRGATAVAVSPGFMRSEAMLDHFGVTEATWREAIAKDPHFAQSETPMFVGRAVAALACDPHVACKNGRSFSSAMLAAEYGFDDVDGRRPDWTAYFGKHFADKVARVPPSSDAR